MVACPRSLLAARCIVSLPVRLLACLPEMSCCRDATPCIHARRRQAGRSAGRTHARARARAVCLTTHRDSGRLDGIKLQDLALDDLVCVGV
ncbi:hypothetical protein BKA80DRAFT_280939 [Phyllosticta citrichinensis]